MKKKILSVLIAAAMITSAASVFAANELPEGFVPADGARVEETANEKENTAAFLKLEAVVNSVEDNMINATVNEEKMNFTVSEDTLFYNLGAEEKEAGDIKEGDKLFVFVDGNSPAPLILPAQYTPSVIVIDDEEKEEGFSNAVDVDTYVKSPVFGEVTNKANDLALNLDEKSDIVDLEGNKVEYTELANKNLIVFYSKVALSLPGQTYPEKVIVMGDAKVEEIETPQASDKTYTKNTAVVKSVEDGVIAATMGEEEVFFTTDDATLVYKTSGEANEVKNIKEGDTIDVYVLANIAVPLIYPARYPASVIITDFDEEKPGFVDVDAYGKLENGDIVNRSNTLLLHISDDVEIVDKDGKKTTDIEDKNLIVFYTASTKSLPAQTTPSKVVVIGDAPETVQPTAVPTVKPTEKPDENKDIEIVVNNEKVDFSKYDDIKPINDNGTVLVPIRAIMEALGAEVNWEGETKTVTISKDGKDVKLVIGSKEVVVGDETKKLEVAPKIENDYTFIPVRAISEAFGYTVECDKTNTVITIK